MPERISSSEPLPVPTLPFDAATREVVNRLGSQEQNAFFKLLREAEECRIKGATVDGATVEQLLKALDCVELSESILWRIEHSLGFLQQNGQILPSEEVRLIAATGAHFALGLLRRATEGGAVAWRLTQLGADQQSPELARLAGQLIRKGHGCRADPYSAASSARHWSTAVRRALGARRDTLELLGVPEWQAQYAGAAATQARRDTAHHLPQLTSQLMTDLREGGAQESHSFTPRGARSGARTAPWGSVACAALGLELGRCGQARHVGLRRTDAAGRRETLCIPGTFRLRATPLDGPGELLRLLRTHLDRHSEAWAQVERGPRHSELPEVRQLIRLLDRRRPEDTRAVPLGDGHLISRAELGLAAAARHYQEECP